jgi:hypothetical protein
MSSRLRSAFDTFGPVDASLFLAGRALEKLSGGRCRIQKYILVAQPVPAEPAQTAPGRSASMEIRSIGPDEASRLDWPRPREVIERRFAEGATCVAAFIKGRLAGFQWVSARPYEEDELRTLFVPLPPGRAAWDFDIWIAPEYRLGRVFIRLWEATNLRLRSAGVEWSMSRISAFAPESLRSHARLEARRLGSCVYLILGFLQISLLPCRPFVHVGLSARSRPVVGVGPDGIRGARAVDRSTPSTPEALDSRNLP